MLRSQLISLCSTPEHIHQLVNWIHRFCLHVLPKLNILHVLKMLYNEVLKRNHIITCHIGITTSQHHTTDLPHRTSVSQLYITTEYNSILLIVIFIYTHTHTEWSCLFGSCGSEGTVSHCMTPLEPRWLSVWMNNRTFKLVNHKQDSVSAACDKCICHSLGDVYTNDWVTGRCKMGGGGCQQWKRRKGGQ